MTDDLLRLSDWLTAEGCTHVAIESTGIYWKPVFNLLEGPLSVILVNARDVKAVPGRKTDVRDCEWLADLLRHGLLKASFIPPLEIRELRELTRYRQTLVKAHTALANRIQKLTLVGQHQARAGRVGRARRLRPDDAARAGRRRGGYRSAGGDGAQLSQD
jgi:hypothetical protein